MESAGWRVNRCARSVPATDSVGADPRESERDPRVRACRHALASSHGQTPDRAPAVCAGNSSVMTRPFAFVLVALMLIAACAGGPESSRVSGHTSTERPVLESTTPTSTTRVTRNSAACSRTLLPVYRARNGDVLNPDDVESLDVPPPGPPTDSAGNPVVAVGPTLEITRTDGTITLARPGGTVYFRPWPVERRRSRRRRAKRLRRLRLQRLVA